MAQEVTNYGGIVVYSATAGDVPVVAIRANDEDALPLLGRLIAVQPRLAGVPNVLTLEWNEAQQAAIATGEILGSAADLPVLEWPLQRRLELFVSIAQSFQAIHQRGLWCGPIPPELILLGDNFQPIIIGPTLTPIVPCYSAPENKVDPRPSIAADVYSLGRLLHYVLLLNTPMAPPEALPLLDDLTRMPAGLVRIIRQATTSNVGVRYPDVATLLADVQNYANFNDVGLAHPKFVEENRGITSIVPQKAARVTTPPPPPPSKNKHVTKGWTNELDAKDKKAKAPFVLSPLVRNLLIGIGGMMVILFPLASCVTPLPNWSSWVFSTGAGLFAFGIVPFGAEKENTWRVWLGLLFLTSIPAVGVVPWMNAMGINARMKWGSDATRAAAAKQSMYQGKRDLSNLNLAGFDLHGYMAWGMNFSGTNLEGADLQNSVFAGANFTGARLANAEISGAKFQGATLDNVDGFEEAICDSATTFPDEWQCSTGGHPEAATNKPDKK